MIQDTVWNRGRICGKMRAVTGAGTAGRSMKNNRDAGGMIMKYETVIFDLDGTLIDTLEDLKDSVNYIMRRYGFPERTLEEIRAFVGNGLRRLV